MLGLVGVPSPGPPGLVGGGTGPLGRNDLGSPLFVTPPGGTKLFSSEIILGLKPTIPLQVPSPDVLLGRIS